MERDSMNNNNIDIHNNNVFVENTDEINCIIEKIEQSMNSHRYCFVCEIQETKIHNLLELLV
jgi:hypothetical protein